MPSGAGSPCRHCLGALVIEVDNAVGLWTCSAGRTHHSEDREAELEGVPTVAAHEMDVAHAFACMAAAVEAARAAWVRGELGGDEMQGMEQAHDLLWSAVEEDGIPVGEGGS